MNQMLSRPSGSFFRGQSCRVNGGNIGFTSNDRTEDGLAFHPFLVGWRCILTCCSLYIFVIYRSVTLVIKQTGAPRNNSNWLTNHHKFRQRSFFLAQVNLWPRLSRKTYKTQQKKIQLQLQVPPLIPLWRVAYGMKMAHPWLTRRRAEILWGSTLF